MINFDIAEHKRQMEAIERQKSIERLQEMMKNQQEMMQQRM